MLKQSFAVVAGVTALGFGLASSAEAAGFTVTAEAPGVQDADTSILTNPIVEDFNSVATGNLDLATGTYSEGTIFPADAFGGAGGTGQYISTEGLASNSYTLTLDAAQRYLGFWWSAGDAGNQVEFFSGGNSIFTFNTADVINFISTQSDPDAYLGNPIPNADPNGDAADDAFVFLNFFADDNHTFDEVVFSNTDGTGAFESDNHTIATNYSFGEEGPGNVIPPTAVPEPASMLGLLTVGAIAAGSTLKKKQAAKA
jgi:hypothetical protein